MYPGGAPIIFATFENEEWRYFVSVENVSFLSYESYDFRLKYVV